MSLEVKHRGPERQGGGSQISNLALGFAACGQEKGIQTVAEVGQMNLQAKVRG